MPRAPRPACGQHGKEDVPDSAWWGAPLRESESQSPCRGPLTPTLPAGRGARPRQLDIVSTLTQRRGELGCLLLEHLRRLLLARRRLEGDAFLARDDVNVEV